METQHVSFSDIFKRQWHEAGYGSYDRNELCGFYHKVNDRKVEIIWRPEHPTCEMEAAARRIFRTALAAHDSFSDGQLAYFAETVPTMGHAALMLFSDLETTIGELRKVASMRELEEAASMLPQNPQNLIG